MKKIATLSAIALVTFAPQVMSQATETNFSSQLFNTSAGYEVAFEIDGQPNYPFGAWASSDPFNPGPPQTGANSVVQFFNFVTFDTPQSGNNSLLFGGYNNAARKPSIIDPSIYFSFSQNTSNIQGESITFTTDFVLWNPTPNFWGTDDIFGITLWDTFGGSELAKFAFNPNAPWVANPANQFGFEWYRDGNLQTDTPPLTATNWVIGANSLYRFEAILQGSSFDANIYTLDAQTNNSGVVTNYQVLQSISLIQGGSLGTGVTAADFGSASFDWELTSGDPTDPGGVFYVINDVTVFSTVIPEPGTWAAGLLLLLGAGIAARSRAKRSDPVA
jgi:hypothetical protein